MQPAGAQNRQIGRSRKQLLRAIHEFLCEVWMAQIHILRPTLSSLGLLRLLLVLLRVLNLSLPCTEMHGRVQSRRDDHRSLIDTLRTECLPGEGSFRVRISG